MKMRDKVFIIPRLSHINEISVLQATKLGERLGNEDFVQPTFLIIS